MQTVTVTVTRPRSTDQNRGEEPPRGIVTVLYSIQMDLDLGLVRPVTKADRQHGSPIHQALNKSESYSSPHLEIEVESPGMSHPHTSRHATRTHARGRTQARAHAHAHNLHDHGQHARV